MDKIFYLNELDSEGCLTGETRVMTLPFDTIMQIVDATRSLAIQFRRGGMSLTNLEDVLNAIHDNLDDFDLVTPADEPTP
ncbi:hypothetical protein G6L37_00615 [Agrobacterium rubi]|nr:hypothetical protein [Agrobacterium rubi]NTF23892.1 hypothetical protein [Agrobacterium rubi]